MDHHKSRTLLLAIAILSSHLALNAQASAVSHSLREIKDVPASADSANGSEIYIELDPLDYVFGGGSLLVKRSSTLIKNLRIGVGYFRITLPDFEVNKNSNKDKGWVVKVTNGYELHFDYHIKNPNKGSYTGLMLTSKEWEIQRNGKSSKYNVIGAVWRYGYIWRPWNSGFYLNPWIGVIFDKKVSGKNVVDGETYEIRKVPVFALLYFGYSF